MRRCSATIVVRALVFSGMTSAVAHDEVTPHPTAERTATTTEDITPEPEAPAEEVTVGEPTAPA